MYYQVRICPEWAEDTVSALNITIRTDRQARAGAPLAARILEVVKIPFCPLEALRFSDALGEIPYTTEQKDAEMSFVDREFYIPQRDTSGEVQISYRILPRVQPEGYRSSPYFDLVAETGGVLGSGTTFLLHPPELDSRFDFTLEWDLTALPEGCRGVWSLGAENRVECPDLPNQNMLFTAYMVGKVHCVEEGLAGFYWFDNLPFDASEGAATITAMYGYMSRMFRDEGKPYRVFTRHNHFPGGGGTAFPQSYIYAYGEGDTVTVPGLQSLLAHEMVHNWPTMLDEPAGLGTWYVEGSAEYYSTLVPMEMGICSLEDTAKVINEKAGSYYENPQHHLDNQTLGKLYWSDRRCQRVPYGRGILYLSNLDAEIRRRSEGKRTLLDIELALLKLPKPTPEDFLRVGSEIAGFDLRPGYEAMCAGQLPPPDPDAFGGHFRVTPCKVHFNDAQHSNEKIWREEWTDGYRWTVR